MKRPRITVEDLPGGWLLERVPRHTWTEYFVYLEDCRGFQRIGASFCRRRDAEAFAASYVRHTP